MKGKGESNYEKQKKTVKKKRQESEVRGKREDGGITYDDKLKKVRKWQALLGNITNMQVKIM